MYVKKPDEQLIKEYAEIGVDYNKFTKYGEMNVIVQSFAYEEDDEEDDEDEGTAMTYLNFMPRKAYAAEQTVDLDDEDERNQFIAQLRDSAERMKVWSYLLAKKADEIENGVCDGTSVYFPELEEYHHVDDKDSTDE